MKIRRTLVADITALQQVLDETELLPSDMLPDMISTFTSDDDTPEIWLTCEINAKAVGFCYATPETLANGAWNMLAIAVLPARQGSGCGAALVAALEDTLRSQGHRVLIADTSGTDEFAATRQFYRNNGYTEEARIRNFWADGDDKIIFWKSLK